jgi:hypothetical protein
LEVEWSELPFTRCGKISPGPLGLQTFLQDKSTRLAVNGGCVEEIRKFQGNSFWEY